jgi:hypothetical protein
MPLLLRGIGRLTFCNRRTASTPGKIILVTTAQPLQGAPLMENV